MPTVLLVPDLPLERWPSMDRYAHRLHDWLESTAFGLDVRLAAHIGALTRDAGEGPPRKKKDRRQGFGRWWTQPVDPSRVVLPAPLHGPQRWAARYHFYPWRVKREAKRADIVHILDHSYAHMIASAGRRPVVVTVHDLMPVIVLRSPTDRWREGLRNRFLRQALKLLRQADAYIVGTEWLKKELATWLGTDKNIHVVPFGVDRAFFGESAVARERGRRDWRIPDDAFVVLHVGSTVDRKNVPLV
ncbi:MAG: glycosyltransferase, partial [Gemmatimonadales bacterium]